VLDGQPAAQHWSGQLGGASDAALVRVSQQRPDVADVPAHGVGRQAALGPDVPLELS
jgi:hypothetical protein